MARRVAFDAGFLAALIDDALPVRAAPSSETDNLRERFAYLLERLDAEDADVLVPTPALAEVLVPEHRSTQKVLDWLDRQARFRLGQFDQRAAIECAVLIRQNLVQQPRRPGGRHAIKYDAMILAIAIVEQASVIYTDDDALKSVAKSLGKEAFGFWDLPSPPAPAQRPLPGLS